MCSRDEWCSHVNGSLCSPHVTACHWTRCLATSSLFHINCLKGQSSLIISLCRGLARPPPPFAFTLKILSCLNRICTQIKTHSTSFFSCYIFIINILNLQCLPCSLESSVRLFFFPLRTQLQFYFSFKVNSKKQVYTFHKQGFMKPPLVFTEKIQQ